MARARPAGVPGPAKVSACMGKRAGSAGMQPRLPPILTPPPPRPPGLLVRRFKAETMTTGGLATQLRSAYLSSPPL